jgi:tyrosine-protein phosphatase SIW14
LTSFRLQPFQLLRPIVLLIITGSTLAQQAGVAPQVEGPAKASPTHSIAKRLSGKGIPNFAQVSPNLYRGAQPSAEGLVALKHLGVDIIVDLRGSASDTEKAAVTKLGMQYVSIPSHCPFPKDEPWAHFLKVMQENRDKKVFVHCRLGDDRTGVAVASYRIADEGWSAEEALKEMEDFGFTGVHHAICPGMEKYVLHLPERLKKSSAFREMSPQDSPQQHSDSAK